MEISKYPFPESDTWFVTKTYAPRFDTNGNQVTKREEYGEQVSGEPNEELPRTSTNFVNKVYQKHVNVLFREAAAGGHLNQYQNFFSKIDRYQRNALPPNSELSGLTFITRPRLCLASSSLRQSRMMLSLDTENIRSTAFMIRCMLDTRFCRDNIDLVAQSPMVDVRNPFFVPLCNGLTGISGFPDHQIQTTTTEGGFFSEDQTFAIGSDRLNRTYDLTLSFKDIQHSPLASIFDYWVEYIAQVVRGGMSAYSDDIDNQRINYTVSIYRFNLDPSKKIITKYAKATGCFPRSSPMGDMMNVNENELFVANASRFSIPFVANKIEYNDPAILMDFNILMKRYCPKIVKDEVPILDLTPHNNFQGLPYVVTNKFGIQLVFKDVDYENNDQRLAGEPTSFSSGAIDNIV